MWRTCCSDMKGRIHAVWHCGPNKSIEHFSLTEIEQGWRLRGVAMIPIADEPAEIRYVVDTDDLWHTTSASVDFGERTIEVTVNEGTWTVNGVVDHDLQGCIDIDLGWTPSTNTLPTRRVDPKVGDLVETRVAWLRFPEMTLDRKSVV